MQKIILIPAFEPDEKLLKLVDTLKTYKDIKLIIVNDGSNSQFDSIFSKVKKHAHLISYEENQGKGFALKTGLKYIKENFNAPYVVTTMDSDGQHTVEDAFKLCAYIEKHPDDLVIGKRIRDKSIPLKSKIGNDITKIVYSLSTGVELYDTQTGLRAFSDKLMDILLDISGNRYEYEMNVLLKLPKKGIFIKEIEIQTIYENNNATTHFKALKDSFRIYKQIIKFSLSSLSSFFIDYLLYSLSVLLTQNIVLSNVLARGVSCSANFLINKQLVFKSKGNAYKSALQYFLLALAILVLNTTILNFLIAHFTLNPYIAKIVVELMLFLISWLVQQKIIFKHKQKNN